MFSAPDAQGGEAALHGTPDAGTETRPRGDVCSRLSAALGWPRFRSHSTGSGAGKPLLAIVAVVLGALTPTAAFAQFGDFDAQFTLLGDAVDSVACGKEQAPTLPSGEWWTPARIEVWNDLPPGATYGLIELLQACGPLPPPEVREAGELGDACPDAAPNSSLCIAVRAVRRDGATALMAAWEPQKVKSELRAELRSWVYSGSAALSRYAAGLAKLCEGESSVEEGEAVVLALGDAVEAVPGKNSLVELYWYSNLGRCASRRAAQDRRLLRKLSRRCLRDSSFPTLCEDVATQLAAWPQGHTAPPPYKVLRESTSALVKGLEEASSSD